jgi:hypothetical protein
MENIIVLKNTPCYHHSLKFISEGKKGDIFKLITNDISAIRRYKEVDRDAIMLAGGPKIITDKLLPDNNNYKVAQIIYQKGKYYIILKKIKDDISSNGSAEDV